MKLSSYIRLQAASVGTTVAASAGAAVAAEAAGVAHASILLEFHQEQFNCCKNFFRDFVSIS
jgi:hypothetical protein